MEETLLYVYWCVWWQAEQRLLHLALRVHWGSELRSSTLFIKYYTH